MKIPEIERDLKGRVSPNAIYHIQRLQEEVNSLGNQLTSMAKFLEQVVDALNQLRDVNLKLNDRWRKQMRGGNDLEMVESVLSKPESNN